MRFGILLLLLFAACVMAVVLSVAGEEVEYGQQIFDERADVSGGTYTEAQTHTEVDIVKLAVYSTIDVGVSVYIYLAGDASADAVYTARYLVDGQYEVVLEARDGDNFTIDDPRDPDLEVTGSVFTDHAKWEIPFDDVNATASMILTEATATVPGASPTVYSDSCEWDENDLWKGRYYIGVAYTFSQSGEAKRSVTLDFEDQAAAGFRYWMDSDGDRYVTQDEIDAYLEQLEVDLNWTDMSLGFEQHTSRVLKFDPEIYPGPVTRNYVDRLKYTLKLTYPRPPRDEYDVRWESELNIGPIEYYRATPDSSFTANAITPLDDPGKIYRFGQWGVSGEEASFYNANRTYFMLNGTQMRLYWNTTMMDHQGFTLFREDAPAKDEDKGCNSLFNIMVVPAGFVVLSGWRGVHRRRRPGMGNSLTPPSAP